MDKERLGTVLQIDERKDVISFRHEAMATELVLSLGGVDMSYAKQAAATFFARIDDLESKLSLYRESSDVSRINLAALDSPVSVSSECIDCLEVAAKAAAMTRGIFHVFQGEAAIEAKGERPLFLRESVGGEEETLVEIDRPSRRVRKVSGTGLLDLGGIGKGFALDRAMEEMQDWEVPIALANFGGSTLLFRTSSDVSPWIGYMAGVPVRGLSASALASSGNGFQEGHVIDPRTGRGGGKWKRSFSRCNSGALADALSTAALWMDYDSIEQLNLQGEVALAVESDEGVLGTERFCDWRSR